MEWTIFLHHIFFNFKNSSKQKDMGVTFRSGDYIRFVHVGGRTIKDGEAAAVWNRRGEHTQIIGPKRIIFWSSTIRFLTRFKAGSEQYLKVKHRNGAVEHKKGPVHMYLNPTYHDEITVNDGYHLKENEVIQVCTMPTLCDDPAQPYKANGTSEDQSLLVKSNKRFVHGPMIFIPAADEVVENFDWSNLPSDLEIIDIWDLPSNNSSIVTLHTKKVWNVKVPIGDESRRVYACFAITYEIESIEKAVLHQDPFKPFCASLMADIQELFQEETTKSEVCTFEMIQSLVVEKLSNFKSFRQLLETGEVYGIGIRSIRLLEVSPGNKLQSEINQEYRQALDVKAKVAKKESDILFHELDLKERQKKIEKDAELARKEAKIEADLAEQEFVQRMKAVDRDNELAKKKEKRQLEAWKASDETVLNFLGNLKELGVDMSAFLCTTTDKKATSDIMNRAYSLASSPQVQNDGTMAHD